MSSKFSSNIRGLVASALIESVKSSDDITWAPYTNYIEGNVVIYKANKYVAKENGISGNLPPEHVLGSYSDGGIFWIYVSTENLRETFKKNLFLFIGKSDEWTAENFPDTATVTDQEDFKTFHNMITLVKVTSSNFMLAAHRHDWTPGLVYDAYDSDKDPLDTTSSNRYMNPYYVITDDFNIYKCLDNNNGAISASKPTAVSTSIIYSADGYVWKYMGSVDANASLFATADFFPVEYKTFEDGTPQRSVQNTAKKKSLSTFKIMSQRGTFGDAPLTQVVGTYLEQATAFATKTPTNTIRQVIVTAPGIGYNKETTWATVQNANKLGSGGLVDLILGTGADAGKVTSSIIQNAGANYDDGAVCIIVGDGTIQALATVTIAGDKSISSISITEPGQNYTWAKAYIIPGDAGAVAYPVMAPYDGHGSNIVNELCARTALLNVRLRDTEGYLLTGPTSDFRQIGLITDVKDSDDEYAYSSMYIGPSHDSFLVSGSPLRKVSEGEGYIIYLNNTQSIVRSSGQEENLSIAITF